MRSGLEKPGALPLLALVVFSLLTLVPSLSSIYNLKLADLNFYPGGARQVPLLQDGVPEVPTAHPLTEPHRPWALGAPHRSRVNLLTRTARLDNVAVVSASETTAIANKSRLSSLTRESPFSFSRRARAFKTYFIQQLDDYPFLTSFSKRSLVEPTPYPTTTFNHSLPTSNHPSNTYNDSSDSIQKNGLQAPSIREMCQQACRLAIDFGKRATLHGTEYAKSIFLESSDPPTTLIRHPKDPQDQSSPSEPAIQRLAAEDSTDAAGRHSQELRGSCMAVVIGLVAGIMWF
ncbi:uncharacterized protein N7529_007603 [Penicillium soppii]|uniref:uncharacterized protein n=1 Tax=Penicillium soppii TaxID=69789 RepID=UPI002548CF65|nr:uncharacterized protein N7529_007603 [Penicillium soppii]KAJ5860293.1 hypothetical protein N7529_007603 [Penicillium soppii]